MPSQGSLNWPIWTGLIGAACYYVNIKKMEVYLHNPNHYMMTQPYVRPLPAPGQPDTFVAPTGAAAGGGHHH